MFNPRSRFELYLELLTQVHDGNCQLSKLMKCTNLSWPGLNRVMGPLISEGLLVEVEGAGDTRSEAWYKMTEEGEQLLKSLKLVFSLVDLENRHN